MRLADVQALMWRAITWPTGVADFLAQADEATRQAFDATFSGTKDFDAVRRMEIYANAYFWRLYGVLAENHPLTAWLLGESTFRNLTTDYLLAHPSKDSDLRHVGVELPAFLADHPTTREHPGLVQVAEAEAAMGRALHHLDHPAATREELAKVDPASWPRLRLRTHPTLELIPCSWDYAALAAQRARGEEPPELADAPASPSAGPLCVWRQGYAVRRRRLQPKEAQALHLAQSGPSFGELCAQLSPDPQSLPALAAQLAGWLQIWVDSGLLCTIEVDPPLVDD
jgi:hypothetical protein